MVSTLDFRFGGCCLEAHESLLFCSVLSVTHYFISSQTAGIADQAAAGAVVIQVMMKEEEVEKIESEKCQVYTVYQLLA